MPRVAIDCFHEHLPPLAAGRFGEAGQLGDASVAVASRRRSGEASDSPDGGVIVAVDVIRASTTAVTAAALGKRLYPAGSIEAAVRIAADLDRPILAGELGGVQPYGFDVQNSPSEIEALDAGSRPVILLSTSGTRLMAEASRRTLTYVSCLRNAAAQAAHLAERGADVTILGADSRGEFREEDQLCAARIARALVEKGYEVAGRATEQVLERFGAAPDDAFAQGRSAKYLRDTGQQHDLEFVLGHIDDLSSVFAVEQGEVRAVPGG